MADVKEVKAGAAGAEAPAQEDNRPFWQRKRVIGAVVAAAVAAYTVLSSQLGLPPIPEWVYAALGAIGVTVAGYEATKATTPKA